MKALIRPGSGDVTPTDGNQVINLLLSLYYDHFWILIDAILSSQCYRIPDSRV